MNSFNIRSAKVSDAKTLAAIHFTSFERAYSENDFTQSLNNNCWCWLAEQNSQAIGFILLQPSGDDAEILSLAVSTLHRSLGIATALVQKAIEELQSKKVNTIFLEVRENNQTAYNLYQKFDFNEIARRKNYYQLGNLFFDALVMQKNLN